MANVPGLKSDVFFGSSNQLPDWREVVAQRAGLTKDDGSDDDEPSKEDLDSVKRILGFDPDEIDKPLES